VKKSVNKSTSSINNTTANNIVLNSSLVKNLLQSKLSTNEKTNNKVEKAFMGKKIKSMHDLSKVGFSGPGVKKTNQDIAIIYKNLMNDSSCMFLSVW
jgi:hypothetical protein